MVIVRVEPVLEGSGAGSVRAVEADIGPLLQQGAVETFYLAVGLRSIGAGATVSRPEFSASAGEETTAVGRTVVGEDRLDGNRTLGKPDLGAGPESNDGLGSLVVQDLAVGKTGVVIDSRVDVGKARLAGPWGVASAVDPPAAARANATELLDVHMHQVARSCVLGTADGAPRGPVKPAEPLEAQAAEHPVDRRRSHPQAIGDTDRSQLPLPAELLNLPHRWC